MNTHINPISARGPARTFNSQKAFKAIALLLVSCMANVYVFADARKPNGSDKDAAPNIAPSKLLLGRLFVPYHQEILVDGHRAMSGDTIFSESRIQTPDAARSVTVDIGSKAKLDVEPDTDLVLTFDQKSVQVKVAAGNAVLTTDDGITGEVIMPDGKTYKSRPNGDSPPVAGAVLLPVLIIIAIIGIITVAVITIIFKKRKKNKATTLTFTCNIVSPIAPCMEA